MKMPTTPTSPPEADTLLARIPALLPMRRGSVGVRFQKCGKASCACASDPSARHGPYHTWTRVIDGKTHSRVLTPTQAELVRQQIASGAEFRALIEQFWEAAERLADEAIATPRTAPPAAEKGGSATSSRRRSKPKSPG
jgi:hypothetical protein